MLCDLEVVLRSGERKSTRVEYHRGHWRNPMSNDEVAGKFRSLAGELLPSAQVDALLARLWQLDDLPEVGELIRATRIEAVPASMPEMNTGL